MKLPDFRVRKGSSTVLRTNNEAEAREAASNHPAFVLEQAHEDKSLPIGYKWVRVKK